MTTPLTKLIADNKWKPIAEAPRDGTLFIAKGKSGMRGFINCLRYSFRSPDGAWYGKDCVTHFRPLPDDNRLARVTEVFLEAMNLHEHMNWVGAALERATAIAEGKE